MKGMRKMKKVPMIFLIALMVSPLFSSAQWMHEISKSLRIQAGYGSVLSINVEPIPSQTQQYLIGMPFSIEDSAVQSSNKGSGRRVASWQLLSNARNFNISVTLEPLVSENIDYALPYVLTFEYSLGYYVGNTINKTDANTFKVYSPNSIVGEIGSGNTVETNTTVTNIINDLALTNNTLFIGGNDGYIYFKFADVVTDDIINSAPIGNYTADVKIKLTEI